MAINFAAWWNAALAAGWANCDLIQGKENVYLHDSTRLDRQGGWGGGDMKGVLVSCPAVPFGFECRALYYTWREGQGVRVKWK